MTEKPTEQTQVKGQWRGDLANINRVGGPPKTHWWSELLKERAEAEDREKKLKNKEIMADALIEKAKAGDINAIKEFGDRVEGKPKQAIVGGEEDDPPVNTSITIRFE